MIRTERAHLNVAAHTHEGMTGKNNEDRYAVTSFRLSETDPMPVLFAVVADGIGGHRAGEVAAELAVDHITQAIAESEAQRPKKILERAIRETSEVIADHAAANPDKKGMGATCACVWVIGDKLYTATVGDSRIYLLREGRFQQLSTDHTWVQEAIEKNIITPDMAHDHPNVHVIRRYLGSAQPVEVDLRLSSDRKAIPSEKNQGMRLYPGDRLILCSDGLSDMVEDEAIRDISRAEALDDVVATLIEEANDNGGKDNITVVAIEIPKQRNFFRLPRIDFRERKVQMLISYIGLGLIGLIMLVALGMFGWRIFFNNPTPTPPPVSPEATVVIIETPTP